MTTYFDALASLADALDDAHRNLFTHECPQWPFNDSLHARTIAIAINATVHDFEAWNAAGRALANRSARIANTIADRIDPATPCAWCSDIAANADEARSYFQFIIESEEESR
jgi:hypothetical protein